MQHSSLNSRLVLQQTEWAEGNIQRVTADTMETPIWRGLLRSANMSTIGSTLLPIFLAANVSMGGKHQLLAAARQFTVIQEYAWAIGRIMAPYQPDGCILVASMEF